MSVDQDKEKEKVVHEDKEPCHDELAEFTIDFNSSTDPVVALKKCINDIGNFLSEVELTQPQTPAI